MLTVSSILCIVAFCALGSIVQSIAGMGFGMVVVPVASLVLGAANGVLFGNIACCFSAFLLLIAKRKYIEWKRGIALGMVSIPAIWLTSWGLSYLHSAYLDLLVGLIMATMVIFSFTAPRFPAFSGIFPLVATGIVAGFLSTAVSQAGSALTTYAQVTRWKQENFAATLQLYFVMLYPVIIVSKLYSGLGKGNVFNLWLLGPVAIAILSGVVLAIPISRLVGSIRARYFALSLSAGGACLICGRGIRALLS